MTLFDILNHTQAICSVVAYILLCVSYSVKSPLKLRWLGLFAACFNLVGRVVMACMPSGIIMYPHIIGAVISIVMHGYRIHRYDIDKKSF